MLIRARAEAAAGEVRIDLVREGLAWFSELGSEPPLDQPTAQVLQPPTTVFTAADGLPTGRINTLYLDHTGRLWVATSHGISRVDAPAAARPTFVNYSTAQGLSGNVIFAITEDLYGRIYIGSGLTKADIDLMKKDWRLIGEKKKR